VNVHGELGRASTDEDVERDLLSLAPESIEAVYTRYSLFNAAAGCSLAGPVAAGAPHPRVQLL
jgi:hypothetical protein